MSRDDNPSNSNQKEKRNSLLGWFMTREEPDQDFIPDLQSQWSQMDFPGRVKFVVGIIIGAVLFFGALYVVYLILSIMAR